MEGFRELARVFEAVRILRSRIAHRVGAVEEVPLLDALGRVCGEDVRAPIDSPGFDRSALDGYAVIAEDTFGASQTNPIQLEVIGESRVGADLRKLPRIRRGQAIEIMTGAPMPPGANAVVPVEKAKRIGGFVEVYDQVHPNQNVSKRGEDYSRGDLVLGRGWIVKPWHIGALASLGITVVKVLRKPRAAIISTGRELVELGNPLEPGRVYNSTKPMLEALLKAYGVESLDFGIVEDDEEAVSERIREGLRAADLVIITGGTSVGALDLVPEAVSKLCDFMIHGFAIRPGKPTGFAISHGKPIFMLSGFPVAALIGFTILVPPALEEMLGCRFDPPPRIRGRLLRRVASPPGIRSYIRVRVYRGESGEVLVEPLRTTGSGILSTLTRGNGLLTIPEEVEGYDEGDEVEVELLSPIYEGGAA